LVKALLLMLGRVAWYLATILIAIIFLGIQRADEEATCLYQEFVESFKGDDVPGGKAFMRGETINPDDPGKTVIEGLVYVLYVFLPD